LVVGDERHAGRLHDWRVGCAIDEAGEISAVPIDESRLLKS
jgi:hypothetical protein